MRCRPRCQDADVGAGEGTALLVGAALTDGIGVWDGMGSGGPVIWVGVGTGGMPRMGDGEEAEVPAGNGEAATVTVRVTTVLLITTTCEWVSLAGGAGWAA
ncbi:hypothetical protein [Actinoplanes regularis]|uniref:Uncharacterized protein n=1 Tax=Actinoplanes regularis TaxID=52697 RepID=A0A239GAJ7_9ACTN|nr:hypothetical protein [Actinoplanes regularis]GIE90373.1 hypothetical protein Are01nite_68530 [Actinoplanes regularis]SNS66120.1 hypothetical protein SAMN06264365_120102 [Actinoplanes regularis]